VAQAQTAVNVDVVAIYKALGGVGQPEDKAEQVGQAGNGRPAVAKRL